MTALTASSQATKVSIFAGSGSLTYTSNAATISYNLYLDLGGNEWSLGGGIWLEAPEVVVQNGKVTTSGEGAWTYTAGIESILTFRNVEFQGWQKEMFSISGTLICHTCLFKDNIGTIFAIQRNGGKLEVSQSSFSSNRAMFGTVVQVLALDENAILDVNVSESIFRGIAADIEGSIAFFSSDSEAESGSRVINIENCVFESNPGKLFSASIQFISIAISGSTFTNSEAIFTLSLSDSQFTLRNSTINQCVQTPLFVPYLNGSFALSGVNITRISFGPAVQIVNAFYDLRKSIVNLSKVRIIGVNTTDPRWPGGIFASGVTLSMADVEIANISSFANAAFAIIGNSVLIRNLSIHDIMSLFQLVGSFIGCVGSIDSVKIKDGVLQYMQIFEQSFSTLMISNLEMHNLQPLLKVPRVIPFFTLIPTHQFFAQIVFTNVSFSFRPERLATIFWYMESDISLNK